MIYPIDRMVEWFWQSDGYNQLVRFNYQINASWRSRATSYLNAFGLTSIRKWNLFYENFKYENKKYPWMKARKCYRYHRLYILQKMTKYRFLRNLNISHELKALRFLSIMSVNILKSPFDLICRFWTSIFHQNDSFL